MTDAERQRLVRILGMLGSDFAGERANAAHFVEAFMARHGLTWAQALALQSGKAAPQPVQEQEVAEPPQDWNPPDWSAYNETMPGIWERRWHRSVKIYHDASFLFLVGLALFGMLRGLLQGIKGFF
jgi:hypothetical protein